MASHYEAPIRKPLVLGDKSYHDVSADIARPVEGKANRQWWIVFSIALVAFMWGLGCIIYTISTIDSSFRASRFKIFLFSSINTYII